MDNMRIRIYVAKGVSITIVLNRKTNNIISTYWNYEKENY